MFCAYFQLNGTVDCFNYRKSTAEVFQLLSENREILRSIRQQTARAPRSVVNGNQDPDPYSQASDTFSVFNLDPDDKIFEFDAELSKLVPYMRALEKQRKEESERQQATANLIDDSNLIDLSADFESPGPWQTVLHRELTVELGPNFDGESRESRETQEPENSEGSNTSDDTEKEVSAGTSQLPSEPKDLPTLLKIPDWCEDAKIKEIDAGVVEEHESVDVFLDDPVDPFHIPEVEQESLKTHQGSISTESSDRQSVTSSSVGTSRSSSSNFQLHHCHLTFAPASQDGDRRESFKNFGASETTSLHCAAIQGDLTTVKNILRSNERSRDLAASQIMAQVGEKLVTFHGWTALALASYFGHLSIIKYILKHTNANLAGQYQARIKQDQQTPRLLSPIHAAVASVPYLLIFNSSFKSSSTATKSPSKQDLLMITDLQRFRTKQQDLWRYSSNTSASDENNQIIAIKALSDSGHRAFGIDVQDRYRFTVLQAAACGTSLSVVEAILELGGKKKKGLSLFKRSSGDFPDSPLHLAAFWNRTKTVKLFLDKGIGPKSTGYGKRTALHYAAAMGNVEVIELLAAAKAQIDILDDRNYRPLDLALRWGQWDAMKALIAAGADLLFLSTYNREHQNITETILHTAVGAQTASGIKAARYVNYRSIISSQITIIL
jgi:ankyrin repeat protein